MQYWGIEYVKLLIFQRFFIHVGQSCDGRTDWGTETVNWLWWLGQLGFLHESQYTYNFLLGHCPNDINISLALLC